MRDFLLKKLVTELTLNGVAVNIKALYIILAIELSGTNAPELKAG